MDIKGKAELIENVKNTFHHQDGIVLWNTNRGSKIKANTEAGTPNKKYKRVLFGGVRIYCHQIVFILEHGYLPISIDHIDGNGTNNSPANLRAADIHENCWNRGKRSNNTSGYKGVSLHKSTNKYQAEIEVKGKRIYLGLFKTAEEAALKYDDAAVKYFGEFAKTNKQIEYGN